MSLRRVEQVRDRVRYTDEPHEANNWKLIQRRQSRVRRDKGGLQDEMQYRERVFWLFAVCSLFTLFGVILWLTAIGMGY